MLDIDVNALQPLHPKCILEILSAKKLPKGGFIAEIGNQLRPVDLYAYLYARFGQPNGIQNFLRKDDSDNLVHWEWVLAEKRGLISFLGLNFRTEIHFMGDFQGDPAHIDQLIKAIKEDLRNHSKEMSRVRKELLEKWTEFVNPFQRIKTALGSHLAELETLRLSPEDGKDFSVFAMANFKEKWEESLQRYNRGFGLCFGIRAMLPILAEAFVNMLIYVLCRPDIKSDPRLYENVMRQPVDVRIKSLHINCIGFTKAVDYKNEVCGKYHSIVNERNDLLHGNVVIEKLAFGEVYFNETVPVFSEYKPMWEKSLGVGLEVAGFAKIREEHQTVVDVIEFILSCLEPSILAEVRRLLETRNLGFNAKTGRIGILFPTHLVDFRATPKTSEEESTSEMPNTSIQRTEQGLVRQCVTLGKEENQ